MAAPRFALPFAQPVNANGVPLAGAKLYFYESGTSTPKDTYSNSARTTPNTNPVVADSAGRFPSIFLASGAYKVVLKTAAGSVIRTDDPVEYAGDLSDFNFLADLPGAVTRTANSKLSDIVSVKDFGAAGDGTTDDTAAFNAAIAALPDGGTLLIPSGIYILSAQVTLTGSAPWRVTGAGINRTELRWTNSSGGLRWNGSSFSQFKGFSIENMSLTTTYAGGGAALSLGDGSTTIESAITIRNVAVSGAAGIHEPGEYWTRGFDTYGLRFVVVDACRLWGREGLTLTGEALAGIRFRATTSDPQVSFSITNTIIYNWNYGVYGSGWLEGIYIANGEIALCRHPVYVDRSGSSALAGTVTLTNMHFNSWSDCITAIYTTTVLVNNCEIYHGSAPAAGTLDANLVKLGTCKNVTISDNHFSSAYNSVSVNGLVLDGVQHGTVSGNLFRRINGTGVWCTNGTNRIGIVGNTFTGDDITMSTAVTVDSTSARNHSKANVIAENVTSAFVSASATSSWGQRGARAYTTSTQNIGSGSTTKLYWDGATYDHGGFFDNGNDRMTVPSGVNRVRIGAQVQFGGTGTAYSHVVMVSRNGVATWDGVPKISTHGDGPTILVWSDVIDVTPGDYFEVFVLQATGSTIQAGGNGATWFAIEAVE